MKNKYTVLLALSLILPLISAADVNDFDKVLQELLENCPQIEILRNTNYATIETEKALNRISSPEIAIEHVWGRNGVGNKFDVGINQSFDWPGLYRARANAINAQTNANILLEQATLLEKVQEVKSLMIDIIFQKRTIELSSLIFRHMKQMEETATISFERGEISRLELKRAQLERIQTSIQVRENERVLNTLISELESVTGKSNVSEIVAQVTEIPESSVHSEEEYENLYTQFDPRMAYLNAVIKAIGATSKVERMSYSLPSFNIGYAFQREQGETFNGFNISFTLPIYGSSHVRNAAKSNMIAAQLEAQIEQISLLSRMRNQRATVLSLGKELADYAEIFENDNYAELLKLALEGGQTDNIHYLQELNYYIEVTNQYLELRHQYHLALVSLNRYDMFVE